MLEKKLLAGVPPLRYGDPSAVCYIGAAQRLLEALGETVGQDELFALCGAGLCFPWGFGTCCDEVGIIPEIPTRTLAAFGYESEYLTGGTLADKSAVLAKIRASIDAGQAGDRLRHHGQNADGLSDRRLRRQRPVYARLPAAGKTDRKRRDAVLFR